jgi:hypothetical protein
MYCAVYLVPDLTGSGPISATGLPPGERIVDVVRSAEEAAWRKGVA